MKYSFGNFSADDLFNDLLKDKLVNEKLFDIVKEIKEDIKKFPNSKSEINNQMLSDLEKIENEFNKTKKIFEMAEQLKNVVDSKNNIKKEPDSVVNKNVNIKNNYKTGILNVLNVIPFDLNDGEMRSYLVTGTNEIDRFNFNYYLWAIYELILEGKLFYKGELTKNELIKKLDSFIFSLKK